MSSNCSDHWHRQTTHSLWFWISAKLPNKNDCFSLPTLIFILHRLSHLLWPLDLISVIIKQLFPYQWHPNPPSEVMLSLPTSHGTLIVIIYNRQKAGDVIEYASHPSIVFTSTFCSDPFAYIPLIYFMPFILRKAVGIN